MNAFARGKRGIKSIYVPLQSGALVQRSTGTASATVVRAITRLVAELRDNQRWTLLSAVTSTPARLTLLDLYNANASKTLDVLEARLASVRLADVKAAWLASVESRLGVSKNEHSSAKNYDGQVGSFLALYPDATTAELTGANVTAWLVTLTKASPGTKRKYVYAIKSLVAYLLEARALKTDPLAGYKLPKKNQRRERWETAANDQRIVDAAIPQYRALFALIKSVGCDVGAARRTLVRDLDLDRATVFVRGTKTHKRQVPEAAIEAWAIPYLRAFIKGKLPNTPLWPDVTNSGAGHHHSRCCEAVGIDDYTLKDARHSVAVRMRFAGKGFDEIAGQLGNSPAVCADVYARYHQLDPRAIDARKSGT